MATLKVDVDPASDHILGSNTAPVTLVEYGDYECPHCAKAHPVVAVVREALGDQLRFVFRNFPLSEIHRHAVNAAEAAEAADKQGKFWEMHDAIYEHQREGLTDDRLLALAVSVGADAEQIKEALDNDTYFDKVQNDFMSGVRSGVNGTPSFFINGVRHDDSWDPETLIEALKAAAAK